MNTTIDISKLLYVISRPVRRVKFETIWNITSGIYAKYYVQIMLLFVYTTTRKGFVIFTCRYFKLSWNTTALSQSNCRNFSCSIIKPKTIKNKSETARQQDKAYSRWYKWYITIQTFYEVIFKANFQKVLDK